MSASDIAISVRNLGKTYTIAHNAPRHVTLAEAMLERLRHPLARHRLETFHALQDVSFEVKRGDVVGIIGRNGAGKSTLLKVLSRITEPTNGQIDLYGRVGSLLEVGTGFHPELTGRENIFLNGAILGMTRSEIRKQFDAIVDFAGVEQFLDTPVKRYSSGMYVKLAFAVAAHLNNDILIVDEVLSVGDTEFQKKCVGKMQDVAAGQGRTVLFVSHNMAVLQVLCRDGILLKHGVVDFSGPVDEVASLYLSELERSAQNPLQDRTDRRGSGASRLVGIELIDQDSSPVRVATTGRPLRIEFQLSDPVRDPRFIFALYDLHGHLVVDFDSSQCSEVDVRSSQPESVVHCDLDEVTLVPGRYRMNVALSCGHELFDHVEGALLIEVTEGTLRGRPVPRGTRGVATIPHRWHFLSASASLTCHR